MLWPPSSELTRLQYSEILGATLVSLGLYCTDHPCIPGCLSCRTLGCRDTLKRNEGFAHCPLTSQPYKFPADWTIRKHPWNRPCLFACWKPPRQIILGFCRPGILSCSTVVTTSSFCCLQRHTKRLRRIATNFRLPLSARIGAKQFESRYKVHTIEVIAEPGIGLSRPKAKRS